MTSLPHFALLALALGAVPEPDWLPLRWQAANGPRDVTYLQPSAKVAGGVLSVTVRRDRALLLKQDPTIAPETNPWTGMELQVQCTENRWRVVHATSTDATGKFVGSVDDGKEWLPIEPASLANAVRTRLCPAA